MTKATKEKLSKDTGFSSQRESTEFSLAHPCLSFLLMEIPSHDRD